MTRRDVQGSGPARNEDHDEAHDEDPDDEGRAGEVGTATLEASRDGAARRRGA